MNFLSNKFNQLAVYIRYNLTFKISLNKDKLNQLEFNEQERLRDKIRIKFNIEKFLNENHSINETSKNLKF